MRPAKPVSTRLALALALVVCVVASTATFALVRIAASSEARANETKTHAEDMILAERLRATIEETVATGRGALLTSSPDFSRKVRQAEVSSDQIIERLLRRKRAPDAATHLQRVQAAFEDYKRALGTAVDVKEEDSSGVPPAWFEDELVPKRRALDVAIDEFVRHERERLVAAYDEEHAESHRVLLISIASIGIGVVGSVVLALLFSGSISRLYRRERDAASAARAALLAHDELVRMVAHDLKTPLSAITLRTQSMLRAELSPTAERHARAIERATATMSHLVNGLRDAEGIAAGKLRVDAAPCDAAEIIDEAIDLTSSLAAKKSLRVATEVERGARVRADRARVLQVLVNLLTNAMKFASSGGMIRLTIRAEGANAVIAVADQGPGIPPEHQPHVFDRYWTQATDEGHGTGLGLYIAKGIVEAHGGRIWVESRAGEGATFAFTIPLASVGSADPQADTAARSHETARPGTKAARGA